MWCKSGVHSVMFPSIWADLTLIEIVNHFRRHVHDMRECAVLLKEVVSDAAQDRFYWHLIGHAELSMWFVYDFLLSALWSQEEYLDWEDYEGEINIRLITKVLSVCEFCIVSLNLRFGSLLQVPVVYVIMLNCHDLLCQNLVWIFSCYSTLDWGQI